ncbi:MAG: hypothetical protein ACRYGR_08325, partial [Janthinobacterium lividum]
MDEETDHGLPRKDESKSMSSEPFVYTAQVLATMFRYQNSKAVYERLENVVPHGMSDNPTGRKVPVWHIKDAAPALCRLTEEQISSKIRSMAANQLPPNLSQLYWNGEAARLKVQELEGDLWSTSKVTALVGGTFKALRMNLQLIMDRVEQVNGLSDAQRKSLQQL